MKNLKNIILCFLTIVLITFAFPTMVFANNYSTKGVYDYANILSTKDKNDLQSISNKYLKSDISVIFLTIDNTNNQYIEDYVSNFYSNGNFSPNSIIFAVDIDPENKQLFVYPTGAYIETFSQDSITEILNETKGLAMQEQYYNFFVAVEKESSSYIKNPDIMFAKFIPSKVSIAISLAFTLCFVLALFALHNKANIKPKAQVYLNKNFKVTHCHEIFICA